MLYESDKSRDFFEVMSEYKKSVFSKETNRAESFLENLGDGDADKGLEKLKKELEDGE